MRHCLFYTLLVLAFLNTASAQWTQQPSPTKNNLNDVAFLGSKLGYAVGANGTVLKTLNGGSTWKVVTAPDSADIISVTILDSVTVVVTTAGTFGEASIYESRNQGGKWYKVLTDPRTLHATATTHRELYSAGSQIYNSTNFGRTWQAQQLLSSTSTYTQLEFADDNNGIVVGNVSGIVTYSADFWRTTDGGTNWYRCNSFSFPNANAFSTLSSLNADSTIMFTNFYNRFSPGDSSQLILLTNFKLRKDFTDSIWYFDAKIINPSFHDRLSDCKFFEGGSGFATSETGFIYSTSVYGRKWKTEYSSKSALHALYMLDEFTGYAVGDGGLILKREVASNVSINTELIAVQATPNPAIMNVTVNFTLSNSQKISVEVRDAQGNVSIMQAAQLFNKGAQHITLPVGNLQRGLYHINLLAHGKIVGKTQLLVAH